jgi:hypothetical protein
MLVLPAPEGPMMATRSPLATSSDNRSIARCPPGCVSATSASRTCTAADRSPVAHENGRESPRRSGRLTGTVALVSEIARTAGPSLLTLIDGIATVLDDISVMTKVAARKTAGVLGDDLALEAPLTASATP